MTAEFAGRLREYVRVERPLSPRDALGSTPAEKQLVGEYWAAIEAQPSAEISSADSHSAMQRWKFWLRQTDKILPGDTLIWSGREMLVRTVSEDRRLLPKTILEAEERR